MCRTVCGSAKVGVISADGLSYGVCRLTLREERQAAFTPTKEQLSSEAC